MGELGVGGGGPARSCTIRGFRAEKSWSCTDRASDVPPTQVTIGAMASVRRRPSASPQIAAPN
jgi:hypothetical protein